MIPRCSEYTGGFRHPRLARFRHPVSATSTAPSPLYLDAPDAVGRFLASIAGARTLALDTEGASFHRYVDRIYLLQISTPQRHAIIDPLRVSTLPQLGSLLESPNVEVVFHDADYDLRLLHQDYAWRVTRLRKVRDRVAAELALDPGVLCPRERLEAVARKNPSDAKQLTEVPELRRWQIDVLGDAFLRSLRNGVSADSPYRD